VAEERHVRRQLRDQLQLHLQTAHPGEWHFFIDLMVMERDPHFNNEKIQISCLATVFALWISLRISQWAVKNNGDRGARCRTIAGVNGKHKVQLPLELCYGTQTVNFKVTQSPEKSKSCDC
jgi:hypothetical protein